VGLNGTEVVAADKKFEIASSILSDKELADAVSIIGWECYSANFVLAIICTIIFCTGLTIQELTVIVMPLRLASHYGPLRTIVLTTMK